MSAPVATITVDRRDLLTELTHAKRIAVSKSSIPILSHVLLRADDGALRIEASDLDTTLHTWTPAAVEGSGAITVSARILLNIVKAAPPGDVRLRLLRPETADAPSLAVSAGAARWRVRALSDENWPKPPAVAEDGPRVEVEGSVWRRLMAMTLYAVSKEESRFQLAGPRLEVGGGTLRIVATDGHRLNVTEVQAAGEMPPHLLRGKALVEISKMAGADPVSYQHGETHGAFCCGRRKVFVRHLDGTFPDYARIIEKDPPAVATLARKDLQAAAARMQQLDMRGYRAPCLLLRFSSGECELSVVSVDTGESSESLPCELTGAESVTVGINPHYLQQVLAAVEGERVAISLKDAQTVLVFRPAEQSDVRFLCVTMPMNISDDAPRAVRW